MGAGVESMLNNGNKLHFINRVDDTNCGDRVVCPLMHYFDYFKQFNIKRHDMRYIDFESICPVDVVIVGGGGMFDYAEFTNRAINKVLKSGAAVIGWSPGFNTHTEYHGTFETKIDFDRFTLLTVRDFENNYDIAYLPDVTCKLPQFRQQYEIRRKFGIARHKDYPISGLNFDTIANHADIDDILRFISETEIVISNSFHMLYWSILTGRKTICANPFSSKFVSYRHKPVYYVEGVDDFSDCVKRAQSYDILDECVRANDGFFEKVKRIIEGRLEPNTNAPDTYALVTENALLAEKVRDTRLLAGDLLASQLFIDKGNGFNEEDKLIAINNVYGDKLHKVRYDISDFDEIKGLRFDPIETCNCKVEIISAKTADSDVTVSPQAFVKAEKWDIFLSTDPQYYISSPCKGFLEIVFKLRLLSLFETEQNICKYSAERDSVIAERDNIRNSISWKITAPIRTIIDHW